MLWSDAGSRVIHKTGDGVDILGGAVKRNDKANDALYFKFHVDPLSDAANEEKWRTPRQSKQTAAEQDEKSLAVMPCHPRRKVPQ